MTTDQSKKEIRESAMRDERRKIRFIHRIQNHQFQKLFFKNWLQVFLCIMFPLIFCAIAIQHYSTESLLREMDKSVQRSVRNTNATVETLFEEVCDTLKKESYDSSITSFLQEERTLPASYSFVVQTNDILDRITADCRGNLYYSVDVYYAVNDFLVSSLYRGQSYGWIADKSLVSAFEGYLDKNPQQSLFAAPRTASYVGQEHRVITVYQIVSTAEEKRTFVSVSVDEEKLVDYIVDNEVSNQGAYLIVDSNNQVILDTSGQMNDQRLPLPESGKEVSSITEEINGQKMRMSWIGMERFGWKCVQMIPMEEYQYNAVRLQRMVILTILFGVIASILLSYSATVKLFRPVEAILQLLENPSEQDRIENENNEIQYLLFRILELFQQNIALENEMLDRLHALRRARAKALQEQMTPHFINNVLQTINWIAVEETGNENSVTSQSLILLADIIDTGKKQKYSLTTVAEEIEYTRKFVELERLRYGQGIACHYEIEPAAEGLLIPGISLQTLVENSIAHGFRTKSGCGNIYISIRINEQGGLYICVEDDGEGIETGIVERLFEMLEKDYIYTGEHLGLINLFQRFLLIYGEACRFKIRKSSYKGACVEILTPRVSMEWLQFMDKEK